MNFTQLFWFLFVFDPILDVIRSEIVQLQQRLVIIAKRALAVVFAAVQLEIDLKRQSIALTISSNNPNRNKIHNQIRNRYEHIFKQTMHIGEAFYA